jgi:hypothetical protein
MAKKVANDKQNTVNEQVQQMVLPIDAELKPQVIMAPPPPIMTKPETPTVLQELLHAGISTSVDKMMVKHQIPAFFENAVGGVLRGLAGPAFELGTFFYLRDRGLQDEQLAATLLTPLALKGNAEAQMRLGVTYMRLNQLTEALLWLEKASAQGSLKAMFVAGKCYEHAFKPGLARLAYSRMAERGNKYGLEALLDLDKLDKKKFGTLLRQAYEGDAEAQYQLGSEYIRHSHNEVSDTASHSLLTFGLTWLKKAATRGHEPARLLYNQELSQISASEQSLFTKEAAHE